MDLVIVGVLMNEWWLRLKLQVGLSHLRMEALMLLVSVCEDS